jgi:hypothetical protein
VDGYNVSGDENQITGKFTADELDTTTFGDTGFHSAIAGLTKAQIDSEGFWYADGDSGPEEVFYGRLAGSGSVVTIVPENSATGSTAFFTQVIHFSYEPQSGAAGEPAMFRTSAMGKDQLVRGSLLLPSSTLTTSASSSALDLGEVDQGEKVWAALHVLSVSNAAHLLNVQVQSDTGTAFTTPTTQIQFSTASEIDGEMLSTAGPITDDHWRLRWTVSPSTASFLAVCTVGIHR